MKLYCARHGESTANRLHEFSNSGEQHPLTEAGLAQAHALARRLAGRGVDHVYASPVRRARETAEIVAETLGVAVTVTEALREWSVGIYEGTTDPAGWDLHREVQVQWFEHQQYDRRMPGGESFHDIERRFVPFIDDLTARAGPDQAFVLVAHGGLYLAMLPRIFKNVTFAFAGEHGFPYTSLAEAECRPDGLYCLAWGDVALSAA